MVFSVGQAAVSRDMPYLDPVVRECIPIHTWMHGAASNIQSIEALEAMIPGLAVLAYVSD